LIFKNFCREVTPIEIISAFYSLKWICLNLKKSPPYIAAGENLLQSGECPAVIGDAGEELNGVVSLHNVVDGWIHSVAVDESADDEILPEGRSDELDGICAEELNLNRKYLA